jgi:hypothetical protein
MATDTKDQIIYEEAKRRVKAKRTFWGHFIFYAVVNVICFIIWAFNGLGGYPWFLWVLGPWGIVIILPQYLRTFVFGQKLESRAIAEEVERIKKEQG